MNISNRLSEDVKIVGTLFVKEDLFLDCQVEGEIQSTGNLTIGENAKLKGQVHAINITVFGSIEGDLFSKTRCELKETASLNGNVTASKLRIVEGASFTGKANITKSKKTESKDQQPSN